MLHAFARVYRGIMGLDQAKYQDVLLHLPNNI